MTKWLESPLLLAGSVKACPICGGKSKGFAAGVCPVVREV